MDSESVSAVFGGERLAPPAAAILAERARRVRYDPGEFLWLAGDPARGIHILVEGRINIVRGRGDRMVLIHTVERPGQIFGEVPLLAGTVYPASAVCDRRASCLHVDLETLRAAARIDPVVMEVIARGLARRVVELVETIDTNTLRPVRSRLAAFLRDAAERQGERTVTTFGSQQKLAERLGTVREVVARELVRMRTEGIIESGERGRVTIVDPAALDRIADST